MEKQPWFEFKEGFQRAQPISAMGYLLSYAPASFIIFAFLSVPMTESQPQLRMAVATVFLILSFFSILLKFYFLRKRTRNNFTAPTKVG